MITILEDIIKYPGYYATSNGQIEIEGRKVVEGVMGQDGYYRVLLVNQKGEKFVLVHEVIARYFIKTRRKNGNYFLCHKNWDRSDNRPENLEWRKKEDSNG